MQLIDLRRQILYKGSSFLLLSSASAYDIHKFLELPIAPRYTKENPNMNKFKVDLTTHSILPLSSWLVFCDLVLCDLDSWGGV